MARSGPVRPARGGKRRRSRFRLWLGIVLFIMVSGTGLTLLLYPYPPLPTAEVELARNELQAARRQAGKLAPGPLRRAAASSAVMERLYAYDRSRLFRFQRIAVLDQAIAETRAAAAQAIAEAEQLRTDKDQQAASLIDRLAGELEQLRPDVEFLPPRDHGARRSFARAKLALAQAATARRQGDLVLLDSSLQTAQLEVTLTRESLGKRFERFHNAATRRLWQTWADETIAASRGGRVSIVVDKLGQQLYLMRDGQLAATFEADLGRNALSDKFYAGDGATPEGRYRVKEKRANGSTRWYKALMLDYPNAEDWKTFEKRRRRGEIARGRGPGGLIEVHGSGGKQSNWTDGCVALEDRDMDRLFDAVPVGTPVAIVGTATIDGTSDRKRRGQ